LAELTTPGERLNYKCGAASSPRAVGCVADALFSWLAHANQSPSAFDMPDPPDKPDRDRYIA